MAKTFTQEMTWLHTWSGLIFGWILVPIFVTGSLCVFWFEISVWAKPEAHAIRVAEPAALVDFSEAYLKKTAPDARLWRIKLPETDPREPILTASWVDKHGKTQRTEFVPDGSGTPFKTKTVGGRFFVSFHYALNVLPTEKNPLGLLIVGAASIAFLVGVIGGVVIHKKIFKDFFTFRPKAKSAQRRWLDAHNVLSVLPLPFHFLIVLTGLLYICYAYVPSAINTIYGASDTAAQTALKVTAANGVNSEFANLKTTRPGAVAPNVPLKTLLARYEATIASQPAGTLTIRDPGRANAVVEVFGAHTHGILINNTPRVAFDGASGKVLRVMQGRRPLMGTIIDTGAGLHFVWFGGPGMRILYLVAGMAGAVMMATGQLLFTIKRREKTVSPASERFFQIVDRINVATIAGICFACVAFLWGIRLLPAGMADRPVWEANLFFIAWLFALAHAMVRPRRAAWIEQLGATALLCIALPLTGFMVPDSSLPDMIARGDWKTAGVDLTSVAVGVIFACLARSVSGRPARVAMPKTVLQGA